MANKEEGMFDKVKGRVKKAAGDLTDDPGLRQEGGKEENRGEAKEELEQAHEKVEEKTREVKNRE